MTAPCSPMTDGRAAEPISTGSNEVISPEVFAIACREIVRLHAGDRAHRELDRLVTDLLSNLGFGEGMSIFIEAVAPYHQGDDAT